MEISLQSTEALLLLLGNPSKRNSAAGQKNCPAAFMEEL